MGPAFHPLITWTRIVQTIFAVVSLSLNASVIHHFDTHQYPEGGPGYLAFLVFAATFSILITIPYNTFAPHYFPDYINRYSSLVVELLTTIFWFSGFIAGAVWLGTIDFCAGFICNNARAGVVFSALVFVTFCITSKFPIIHCFFDDEDRALGNGNRALRLGGAEKLAQIRRHRQNQSIVPSHSAFNDDEDDGIIDKIRSRAGIAKVRLGNVMQEWCSKAGREPDLHPGPIVTRQLSKRSEHGSMV